MALHKALLWKRNGSARLAQAVGLILARKFGSRYLRRTLCRPRVLYLKFHGRCRRLGLLRSRRRVPRENIERGQNGAGECQDRDGKIYGLCHARTLITASASAQTPIHNASTAIVPKATRPMPVIASLIGASSFCTRQQCLKCRNRLTVGINADWVPAYKRSFEPRYPEP